MRVLITGITGMIGTHLAATLAKNGCEIAGISRATSASRHNIQPKPYVEYLGDILDRSFLKSVWQSWQPELIYHLAAQAYNGASWEAEESTYAVNIEGSKNVLQTCRDFSPDARIIPACSSAAYGRSADASSPLKENTILHATPEQML